MSLTPENASPNMGEMVDADAVGTAGSPGCGDMMRVWLKFREENGRKMIDKASFQGFGCETAIAVANVATQMIQGKPVEEALEMKGTDLAAPLGPLPPMKIHCATLVEEALRLAIQEKPEKKKVVASSPRQGEMLHKMETLSSSMEDAANLRSGMKIKLKKN